MTVRHDNLRVSWLGYATARLEWPEGYVAYFDPGRYGVLTGEWTPPAGGDPGAAAHPRATDHRPRDADLVCITHDHHYDSDGVERVAADDATLVVYEGVDVSNIDRDVVAPEELSGDYEVVRVSDEAHVELDGTDVWTVPSYNDPEGPYAESDGSVPHPPGFGAGYRIKRAGTSAFWPGDSDAFDSFAALDVSLFLANVSGSVCMDRREAADLAEAMDPDLVLPIHYNTLEFLEADSAAFAADVAGRGVPVVLDER